jgi:amidase
VDAFNPKLNALCHLFFDKAEAQINDGLGSGPFHGVPFVLKDLNQYLAGTITSAGSRIWKNSMADFDSTLVQRYKQAGLVIFGKTNSPELGLTTTTESVAFGQTHNPWNLERTTGGSSGGAGAVVAMMAADQSGFRLLVVGFSVLSRRVRAFRSARTNSKAGTAVRSIMR